MDCEKFILHRGLAKYTEKGMESVRSFIVCYESPATTWSSRLISHKEQENCSPCSYPVIDDFVQKGQMKSELATLSRLSRETGPP